MEKPKEKDITERNDFIAACMLIAALLTAGDLTHSRNWYYASIPKGILMALVGYVGAFFLVFLFGCIGSSVCHWSEPDKNGKKGIVFWICYGASCIGVSLVLATILPRR